MRRVCFIVDCELDAIPSAKYCATHHRASQRWLTDERYLDALEDRRRFFRQDDRPSVAEEINALGWDPLGDGEEWSIHGDDDDGAGQEAKYVPREPVRLPSDDEPPDRMIDAA